MDKKTFKVKVKLNPDKNKVAEVREKLKKTNRQCPCIASSAWNNDTICPCKEVRETGNCICGLYVLADEPANQNQSPIFSTFTFNKN